MESFSAFGHVPVFVPCNICPVKTLTLIFRTKLKSEISHNVEPIKRFDPYPDIYTFRDVRRRRRSAVFPPERGIFRITFGFFRRLRDSTVPPPASRPADIPG